MYYQSLNILKEGKLSLEIDDNILNDTLSKLDSWLISLNGYNVHRINPRKFSIDKNVNLQIAKTVFLAGVHSKIFDIYFEVRSDDNEYLQTLNYREYSKVIEGEKTFLYSIIEDREIEISEHNIHIWFDLLIEPTFEPSFLIKKEESEVSPTTSDDFSSKDFAKWMGR